MYEKRKRGIKREREIHSKRARKGYKERIKNRSERQRPTSWLKEREKDGQRIKGTEVLKEILCFIPNKDSGIKGRGGVDGKGTREGRRDRNRVRKVERPKEIMI